ncbi:TetR/AcrR family transcriptional regulator [Hydromonas duriensis]|uniref:TetR family transcriptional regulator n=1 Tax=Hydromonas duriensis TaxID=1527608 RepID=A0A4R6YB45_9BURK|nr:TetR/AcrR family transcriptional regulator [Hydromonas duriensis]TDR32800.1 TetR family transcriptional regulator [Hydromonas duriensis]
MRTDRKQELLNIGFNLMMLRGYDSISFADLAKASGIAKPTIHHHFPTKQDFGLALLDQIENGLTERFKGLLAMPPEQVLPMLEQALHTFDPNGRICPISSLQAHHQSLSEPLQQRLIEVTELELNFVSQLFERLRNALHWNVNISSDAAANLIMFQTKSALQYGRALGKNLLPQAMATTLELLGIAR